MRREPPPINQFLTVQHASQVLYCRESDIYRLIGTGKLRAVKVANSYRIRPEWLLEFAEGEGEERHVH